VRYAGPAIESRSLSIAIAASIVSWHARTRARAGVREGRAAVWGRATVASDMIASPRGDAVGCRELENHELVNLARQIETMRS